jgi:LysM repeat protein
MKKIFFLLSISLCISQAPARAADQAVEERINQLSGKIEDLIAGQDVQRKRIAELAREVDSLKSEQSKPSPNYANEEDLKRLAEAVKEIDRKRMDDFGRIHDEILKLGKTMANSATTPPARRSKQGSSATASNGDEGSLVPATPDAKGYEYVVKQGDTLSLIVAAYREQNIKVTVDQILKANPGLKPERMPTGKKIFIPAPPK